MPEKKNQHFVPRCALKPFSLDGAGLAINLFNIPRARAIQNAAVKSQCARDYFYGKGENSAEGLLAKLEEQYARIVLHLSGGANLSTTEEDWLRLFIAVQLRRTEAAINQMRDLTSSMKDKVYARDPEQRADDNRTDSQLMVVSLKIALELKKYGDDLKLVIFANKTGLDFVTCDHPVFFTNRYHIQRLHQHNFGMVSSGAIISMPLSPRLSLMAYDTNVYTLPNATGNSCLDLARKADVCALNQTQYLSADKNIYFRSWDDAKRIGAEVAALSEIRATAGATSQTLVRDYSDGGPGEAYKRGTAEEEANARETLVMTSFRQPEPPDWPSVLKFRSKPKTFWNGSAVGHVRKAEWLHRAP
jgi:hypothetical protein